MKGIVADIKGKYAVVLTQDGLFKRIKALPDMEIGVEIDLDQPSVTKYSRTMMRITSIAAACLLALGAGVGAYSYTVPYSYIDLDINPSVELTVNIYDRIIGVEALNEDGSMLIRDMSLKHMKLDSGVSTLLNSAVEQGYLEVTQSDAGQQSAGGTDASGSEPQPSADTGEVKDSAAVGDTIGTSDTDATINDATDAIKNSAAEDVKIDVTNDAEDSGKKDDPGGKSVPSPAGDAGNSSGVSNASGKKAADAGGSTKIKNAVMVTVSSSNPKKAGSLKKSLEEAASKKLKQDNISSKVLVAQTSLEQREAARRLGVTPGKLALIENVVTNMPEVDLEEIKNTAVKDLLELARSKKSESGNKEKHNESSKAGGDKNSGSNGSKTDKGNNGNNSKNIDNNAKAGGKITDRTANRDDAGSGGNISSGSIIGSIFGNSIGSGSKEDEGSNSKAGSSVKEGPIESPGWSNQTKDSNTKESSKAGDNSSKKDSSGARDNSSAKDNSSIKGNSIPKGNSGTKDANGIFKDMGADDFKKTLEQYGSKLKEERERLREELLKQALTPGAKKDRVDNVESKKTPDAGKKHGNEEKQERPDAVKDREDAGKNMKNSDFAKSRDEDATGKNSNNNSKDTRDSKKDDKSKNGKGSSGKKQDTGNRNGQNGRPRK